MKNNIFNMLYSVYNMIVYIFTPSVRLDYMTDKYPLRRERKDDSGWDIACNKDMIVRARSNAVVTTGISLDIPVGHDVRITGRSSINKEKMYKVHIDVIDRSWIHDISILVYNVSDEDIHISSGDYIAQLLVEKRPKVITRQVDSITRKSSRDITDKFGSTDN